MSVSTISRPGAARVAAMLQGITLPANPPARSMTVGEYYRRREDEAIAKGVSAIGTGLHFSMEAIPGVLLAEMAAIKAKHRHLAYQRIFDLPWDPQGRWKTEADKILDRESRLADAAIRKLPMINVLVSTGQVVVRGATAAGNAVVDGATYVAKGVNAVGDAIYDSGAYVAKQSHQGYKAAGRGFLGWIASIGQSLLSWANRSKPAFS